MSFHPLIFWLPVVSSTDARLSFAFQIHLLESSKIKSPMSLHFLLTFTSKTASIYIKMTKITDEILTANMQQASKSIY